jgi:hypothetical protein
MQNRRNLCKWEHHHFYWIGHVALPKGYHLDVVGGPSIPHDPESNASGSLSSW